MLRIGLTKASFLFIILIPVFSFAQRTSIGFYYGLSLGYNSIYTQQSVASQLGLLDVNLDTEAPFFNSLQLLNNDDLTNGVELINGALFGVKANLPVINGV